MHFPPGHEARSTPDSLHAKAGKPSWPVFRWRFFAFAALSALLLAGCDYRIASEKNVDVCALALDRVTAAFQEVPIAEPSSRACLFRTTKSNVVQRRISIILFTRATEEPNDLDSLSRIILAEAEANHGAPGSNEFGDLAKLAVAFGMNPPEYLDEAVVGGRGALMQIHISGEGLSRDEVIDLTRQLWLRVADYKPPST